MLDVHALFLFLCFTFLSQLPLLSVRPLLWTLPIHSFIYIVSSCSFLRHPFLYSRRFKMRCTCLQRKVWSEEQASTSPPSSPSSLSVVAYANWKIYDDVIQYVVFLVGFIDLSQGKVTADRHHHYPLSSLDSSISLETTYVIPATETSSTSGINNDLSNNKKVRFIIQKQKQQPSSSLITNGNINITSLKSNEMIQRKNLSFVDAVNSKYLDLSTGLFSSPSSFVLSSSSSPFSSSTSPPDQHRHSHNHFSSSSSSPPHTTTTTTNNKNLSTSSLSVNNHPPPVGVDSAITTTNTTTTITLKEAIDANILDARSAYVVDTLEQR